MRYPILTGSKCAELANQMAAGQEPAVEPHVAWVGHGDDPPLAEIEEVAMQITQQAREWADSDRDRFEGKAAVELAEVLQAIPPEVLDDRGFWRYLALRYFWDFIAWREEGAFARGNHLKYVNAGTNTESILPRMFVRARAVAEDPELAGGIPKGTDFWRSHVIRVRTGSAPSVARAFVAKQARHRLQTSALRETARRLNRSWANLVLHLYDNGEASVLIDSIWSDEEDEPLGT